MKILIIKRPLVPIAALYAFVLFIYMSLRGEISPPFEDGSRISVTGTIIDIRKTEGYNGEKYRISIDGGGRGLTKFFIIAETSLVYPEYGNVIRCEGTFKEFEEASNPGQFDYRKYCYNEGYAGTVEAKSVTSVKTSFFHKILYFIPLKLYSLKNAVEDKFKLILNKTDAGTLSAMVLGDKSGLDEEIEALYRDNMISHLLAISGLHISLVGGVMYLLLKKLKSPYAFSPISASIFLILYGIMTGFSVSTARAVIMLVIFFLSFIFGRSYDLPSAMSVSSILLLTGNLRLLYQSGFLLSFSAVAAIFYIMPVIEGLFLKKEKSNKKNIVKNITKFCVSSVICSVSVYILTLPIVLLNFYEVSLSGIILNIIVIPLMSVLVIMGLLGGFVALFSEISGAFLLGNTHFILEFYTFLCKSAEKVPIGRIIAGSPSPVQVVVYYLILFVIFYIFTLIIRKDKILKLKNGEKGLSVKKTVFIRKTVFVASLISALIILFYRKDEFSVNMLDIGQGDCFVVNVGKKHIYISDCGSTSEKEVGKRRLLPFLKYKGWNRVRGIFVSHMDRDHVNGIIELLNYKEIKVDKIIISTGYKNRELDCAELRNLKAAAKKRDIKIFYFKKGDEIRDGSSGFLCLYPKEGDIITEQNEASIVMRMESGGISLLFTGDAGKSTEERILAENERTLIDCDILKVGHHGSKNSSTEGFINEVSPKLSLVSCGLNNRYGHPHRQTVERLEDFKSGILRTDYLGAVILTVNDGKLKITYNKRKKIPKKKVNIHY